MKKLWVLLLVPVLMCGAKEWSALDLAQLRGLRALSITIEHLPDALTIRTEQSDGLSEQQLRAQISDKLTYAGLQVTDSASAYLYVNVNSVPAGTGVAYDISVDLNELAYLARNSATAFAVIAVGGTIGYCRSENFAGIVNKDINDYVDEFVINWLLANKKK